ncbi:MAG TPA: HAD-IA family hydrolase [Solirubrobacteraceae bacterium]|jgi:putative hydrolase of the HAD superfamily|nr:HAD-IA family hydrolase [Solirubrobacteraceae bacterium]
MTDPVHAVLFDFAGTLFSPVPARVWVADAAREVGLELPAEDLSRLAERCLAAGLPGGPYPTAVPDHLARAYALRDLSPSAHRAAYVGLLERALEDHPGLAEVIYERILEPRGWVPYRDARGVLHTLAERGLRLGVISNVGFDLRPILRHHGCAELARRCTLSFEEEVTKPDPRIFRAALRKLGTEPSETVMVGDHPEADGAAAELGLRTLVWPMSSPGDEHGLARVLSFMDGLPAPAYPPVPPPP